MGPLPLISTPILCMRVTHSLRIAMVGGDGGDGMCWLNGSWICTLCNVSANHKSRSPPTHKLPNQTAPSRRESRLLATDKLSQARYPRLPSLLQHSQIRDLLRPWIEHPERDVVTCPHPHVCLDHFIWGKYVWESFMGKTEQSESHSCTPRTRPCDWLRTLPRRRCVHHCAQEWCPSSCVWGTGPNRCVRPQSTCTTMYIRTCT